MPPSADSSPLALFLADARDALGPSSVVADPDLLAAHEVDWTGRVRGRAGAVARPADTGAVAALVELARLHRIALVPQGGNTGLVAGAVPTDGAVVVDLRRLDALLDADASGGQLLVGAGSTLASVQDAARDLGWAYGVDWAARASATIGGSVATDAGGLRFIRHGGTRRQVLGIEAVLGTGAVVRDLPRVEKDNTGYHLPSLLCGSEGTLGLVTAVRLRLVSPPPPTATALLAFEDARAAVAAANGLRREVRGVEALELFLDPGMALVCEVFGLHPPVARGAAYLLVELGDETDPTSRLAEAADSLVGVHDVAVATDLGRRAELFRFRELHTEAISRVGTPHKLDVTLPAEELADFVDQVPALIADHAPEARVWLFGHAGDGNVHVNVTGLEPDDERIDELVFREVAARGGSISAEHGIGRTKRRWMHLAHEPEVLDTMWRLKDTLDPLGILNPGVLLPDRV